MTIVMKALKSFGTLKSAEGPVRQGREFKVKDEGRARDLETRGLAFRLKMQAPSKNKMEAPPENKAAQAGPLEKRGGSTGAEPRASSSLQDRQSVPSTSTRSKPAAST